MSMRVAENSAIRIDPAFHSRRDIMLHPTCPDNAPFVKAVLDSFFDAKEQVRKAASGRSMPNRWRQKNAVR